MTNNDLEASPTTEEILALADEITDILNSTEKPTKTSVRVSLNLRALSVDWSNLCLTHEEVWDTLIGNREALLATQDRPMVRARRALARLTHRH